MFKTDILKEINHQRKEPSLAPMPESDFDELIKQLADEGVVTICADNVEATGKSPCPFLGVR